MSIRFKEKALPDYQHLMQRCFEELLPGAEAWTLDDSGVPQLANSVWNAIQEALQHAGFVVADVRTLDKQQGSYQQVTSRLPSSKTWSSQPTSPTAALRSASN